MRRWPSLVTDDELLEVYFAAATFLPGEINEPVRNRRMLAGLRVIRGMFLAATELRQLEDAARDASSGGRGAG